MDFQTLSCRLRSVFWTSLPPTIPTDFLESDDLYENSGHIIGKSWDELNLQDFDANSWVLASLPGKLFPYYLGAYLELSANRLSFSTCSFQYIIAGFLIPSGGKKRTRISNVLDFRTLLSSDQIVVLLEYLIFSSENASEEESQQINRLIKGLNT